MTRRELVERLRAALPGWTIREAEPLPELVASGWHPLDLRATTCTTGKPEWLTCSEPPHALARPRQLTLPLEATHA